MPFMHCPKEPNEDLNPTELIKDLTVHRCGHCDGNWLPSAHYQRWQAMNAGLNAVPEEALPLALETDYQPALLDGQAGLCPECGTYLKRSRIDLRKSSFYIERCPICEGLWCDRGEWEILESLGLHVQIPVVFAPDWQARIRVLEKVERQRMAVVDKLGPEIAARIFELADMLKGHRHGDFAVGYLMRKFNE
ncbi:MAG: zf-TFIIB domain-containing protein [Phormidesmis sp.]